MVSHKAIHFKNWINDHRHLLKPPVGNQLVYKDSEFIIMVVGGPNSRKDYHFEEGEEFFYQLEGEITLKIMDDNKPIDIPIREGEIFLLPPRVPHNPCRPANTVGLVVERRRRKGEKDAFMWFCEKCQNKLHEHSFVLTDIVSQLPPIFEKFYSNKDFRTCKKCKTVMEPPKPPAHA